MAGRLCAPCKIRFHGEENAVWCNNSQCPHTDLRGPVFGTRLHTEWLTVLQFPKKTAEELGNE